MSALDDQLPAGVEDALEVVLPKLAEFHHALMRAYA